MVLWCGEGGEIPLAQIDAYYLRQGSWRGVRGVDSQRDQEGEALFAPVIPEFGAADLGPVLEPGHVTTIALRGQDHSPGKRQDTHPACGFAGVVAPRDVGQRGRDIVRRLVQPLETFPGPAGFARFHVLVPFGPESLVRRADLAEDTARQLGRQTMPGASLQVEVAMQALAVGGLAMRKGVLACVIQCVTIGQLRLSQCSTLLRCGHQFQFGGEGGLHASLFFFTTIQSEKRCFLPRLKRVGRRTASLMNACECEDLPVLPNAKSRRQCGRGDTAADFVFLFISVGSG